MGFSFPPLILLDGHALLHRRVVWDSVRTLLVKMSQDQLSHLRVLLPDAGGHCRNGKGSLKVRRHLLLSLFLEDGKCHCFEFSANDYFIKNLRMWTHHKLLCQLVKGKVLALWMHRGGDRPPLKHHRLS